MAETLVENKICQHCEAEVRPDTLFCYNCGKSVAPDTVEDLPDKKAVSGAWLRENIAEGKKNGDGQSEANTVQKTIDQPIPKPPLAEEPKLKSAAAMRRKSKTFQPKQVEIIWEEHENSPNGWYLLAALLLTLLVAGILYLAMSLK